MTSVLTVGIAGGTGSGKTSLCHLTARALGQVSVLDLDSYYLDRSGLSPQSRTQLNFDEPAAFDLPLLLEHLEELRNGRAVQKPQYSFEHHVRVGSDRVEPAAICLVEGLFALWWEEVRSFLDLKIFLEASADARLARRLKRDVESRGRSPQSVLQQYEVTVRPMHERYVEPTRRFADVVVANERDLDDSLGALCAALQAVRPGPRAQHVPTA
jgi:uridine kinase